MGPDGFIETLSGLSSKRRQGVLRVTSRTLSCDIVFHDGKILGAHPTGASTSALICRKLVEAGLLPEKVNRIIADAQLNTSQLYDALVAKSYVSREQFLRARHAVELDLLHSLRDTDDGICEFALGTVRSDARFPPLMGPGQLLLDVAELDADEDRFTERFGSLDSEGTILSRRRDRPRSLLPFEAAVWELLADDMTLASIHELSLLSKHELMVGLLALLDHDLVSVNVSEAAERGSEELDDLIPEPAQEDDDMYARVGHDVVALLAHEFDDLVPQGEPFEPDDADDAEVALAHAEESEWDEAAVEEYEESELPPKTTLRDRLLMLNFRLLDPAPLDRMVVGVMLAFLAALALMVPQLLDEWFRALGDFSSKG